MPPGTAGDRRCVRYLRDRLLSSVLNHTPGPLLSATERRPMTLNCRPPGRAKRALDDDGVCPACVLIRGPHPAEPLHTGRLAADAARVVGDQGWRNPTDLPQLRRTRAAADLLREATERTDYVREGRPELEINTDWTGHAKPGHWYGRYYADWDAAHPGAWVRGELVPGGFYGGNWGGSTLSWDANWFSKHGAKMPKGVHYIAPGRSMTRLTEKLNPSDTGVMRLQFRED